MHHFPAFSFFKTSLFFSRKKSIGEMVHIWVLKTAYTILLSNKTHVQLILSLCVILLASEWALPPHFRTPKLIKSLWSWYNVNYTSDCHSIYFKPKLNSLRNFWMHWIGNLSCRFFLYMKNDEVEKNENAGKFSYFRGFSIIFSSCDLII